MLVRALKRGAEWEELLYEGALMMTAVFIVFNKVGSPQFMIWLAPVVVAGLVHDWRRWRTPAALLMGIAVTTFVIYPLFYTPLIHAHQAMAGHDGADRVLTLRLSYDRRCARCRRHRACGRHRRARRSRRDQARRPCWRTGRRR